MAMVERDLARVFGAYLKGQSGCFCGEKKDKPPPHRISFVTISRQAGAGGITIGEKLAEWLTAKGASGECPWTVFDRALVEKVMEEHELPRQLGAYLKEDTISEIEDMLDDLFGVHPPAWTLVRRTSQTILHLAGVGHAILVGRGANIVTAKMEGGLHVRLIGSAEKRRKHLEEFYKFSRKEAEVFVKNEDRGRAAYIKKYFSKNIDDPLLYDLTINTDKISYDEAARIIGSAALA